MNEKERPYTIVIERHGGIGDILFTTPVLHCLRKYGVDGNKEKPLRIIYATQKKNFFILENLFYQKQRLVDEKIADCFPLAWHYPHKSIGDPDRNLAEIKAEICYDPSIPAAKDALREILMQRLQSDNAFIDLAKKNRERIQGGYDAIVSFFEAIERNDVSNFKNAYDLHLEWAGIDSEKVTKEDKLPKYVPRTRDMEQAKKILQKNPGSPRIGIQMHASSLPRTWDKSDRLIRALCRKYPKAAIFSIGDAIARILEPTPEEREPNYMPLAGTTKDARQWAALICSLDLLVSVDTGAMHIAGAAGVPVVGLFSTVPGWTRMRDYRNSIAIDSRYECAPCFRIGVQCARSVPTEGHDFIPALNIRGKNEAYPCLASISMEEVMYAVEKVLS